MYHPLVHEGGGSDTRFPFSFRKFPLFPQILPRLTTLLTLMFLFRVVCKDLDFGQEKVVSFWYLTFQTSFF